MCSLLTLVKKTSDCPHHPATYPTANTDPSSLFRREPIDWQTLNLTIKNMNNSNAGGSDGIPLRFIKDSLPVIASHLTTIMNTSLVTGIFPTARRFSIVVPILKSSEDNDPSNYRPITLLPVLSKLLEKLVSTELIQQITCSVTLNMAADQSYLLLPLYSHPVRTCIPTLIIRKFL